jgi:hypothetical protein
LVEPHFLWAGGLVLENLLEDLCWLPDLRDNFADYSPENVDEFLSTCKRKYDRWLKEASEEAAFNKPGPTLEIDSIWHAHTLNFAAYRADCNRLYKVGHVALLLLFRLLSSS